MDDFVGGKAFDTHVFSALLINALGSRLDYMRHRNYLIVVILDEPQETL